VLFSSGSLTFQGWAVNESRDGLGVIMEDASLPVGSVFDVSVVSAEGARTRRTMRVVWTRRVLGGSVLGLVAADLEV
jgi:hypothetical protein